jgi:hypothetical protein
MRRPEWPGIATAAVVILIGVIGAWLNIFGPIWRSAWTASPDQWLGFAGAIVGSFITSVIAVAAIYFAWRGITRQLRIGLVSREEDRIERDLPGLHDADDLLAILVPYFEASTAASTVIEMIRAAGLGKAGTNLVEEMNAKLPRTDGPTRRRMTEILFALNVAAITAKSAEQELKRATGDVAQIHMFNPAAHEDLRDAFERTRILVERRFADLQVIINELRDFRKYIQKRIATLTARLPELRTEIESFFKN